MNNTPLTRRLGTITAIFASVVATFVLGIAPATVSAADDPLLNQQWGLLQIGAPQVWGQSTGVGVTVAIIDSGSGPHPDLDANLIPGRSFIDGIESAGAIEVDAEKSHGTHVAGIVGAVNGNGIGVSGVAPNARILPIRIFPPVGQSKSSDAALAIRFAADAGVKVINLSFGGINRDQNTVDAIAYAVGKNILIVAAAGNDGPGEPPKWPAADDNTIAVTAVDENRAVTEFDQRGDYIDISAPGVRILSTQQANLPCSGVPQPIGYGCIGGTSMAAPFVSGAAALLFSARPQITAAQVRFLLMSTATDLGDAGKDTTFGAGLLNLPAAFAALNIMFPMVIDPMIATNGRVGFVATGTAPTTAQSPKLQWFRCTAQGVVTTIKPVNCTSITSAVALTYQLTVNDLRKFLRFAVTTTTAGGTTKVLSATSPRVIGVWLKVGTLTRGTTYKFGQFIGSPSKGVRNVKVLSGSCFVKDSTLKVRANATACQIRVTIAAKAPFPQLAFTVTINTPT